MARLTSTSLRCSPFRTSSPTVLSRKRLASPASAISPERSRTLQAICTAFSTTIGRGSVMRLQSDVRRVVPVQNHWQTATASGGWRCYEDDRRGRYHPTNECPLTSTIEHDCKDLRPRKKAWQTSIPNETPHSTQGRGRPCHRKMKGGLLKMSKQTPNSAMFASTLPHVRASLRVVRMHSGRE
jgi:hypothetical protein